MRIAFDARHAGRGLGIATFVINLASAIIEFGHAELVWLGDPAFAPPGVEQCMRLDRLPYPALDGPLGRRLVRKLGADIVHFTGNTSWGVPGPAPVVLTLHDLMFLSTDRRSRTARQIVGHHYEHRLLRRALPTAAALAVPSQTVADEVASRLPAAPRAHVIHEGVSVPPHLKAREASPPYLVAFAGRDPRKRTAEVVEAWRMLGDGVRLCLLASGGIDPRLREQLAPNQSDGSVQILDHVPRHELWELLAGALALAYPTSTEGFGLPVLEGMAVGTPVLAGLAPVTHEIGGDAIVALDERDISGSIAAAVRRLQVDAAWRREVEALGLGRARQFSWRRTAELYEQLYAHALEARTT